ncbi:glucagon-like peptide 1 receptor isoform X2 [Pogoniulus pusillus]|uniref:glucagon-like peptide 1 receptor isoform X2 n=1 Tax=Pogoniulus pusillus TaxID=488313 RepID=UPI0030B9424C
MLLASSWDRPRVSLPEAWWQKGTHVVPATCGVGSGGAGLSRRYRNGFCPAASLTSILSGRWQGWKLKAWPRWGPVCPGCSAQCFPGFDSDREVTAQDVPTAGACIPVALYCLGEPIFSSASVRAAGKAVPSSGTRDSGSQLSPRHCLALRALGRGRSSHEGRAGVQILAEPHPSLLDMPVLCAGLFCNRTFDMYACWPDGSPGTAVNVSCPFYLPWFEKVRHGLVSRRCGADGQWVTVNGSQPWRDYSQCEEELQSTMQEEGARRLLVSFKVLYTAGYALSLLALCSALLVLTLCRRLRCTRNYIHANLFASFGLRAASVLVKDALLERRWGMEVLQVADWEALLSHQAALGCRAAQVLMQYCILANHYWFLVEALYLHKLLIGAVFSEKNHYRLYLYLGWGTPVAFVVPWVAAKYLKENAECWALNENMAYWWIIRIPILLASLINLLIFVRILKVILAKLRANQKGYADYKLRLAKATLTLIPLFGIHEVVFIFATDEQTTGVLRYIKVFFTLSLNSFQHPEVARGH